MSDDPLERLLDRCHRAELVRLAAVIGVKAEAVGQGDLAAACARAVRDAGSHELGTAFRSGQALPYAEIVADAARHRRLPVGDVEANEQAIVRAAFESKWEQLNDAERVALWRSLRLSDAPPATGREAIARAVASLGHKVNFALAQLNRSPHAPAATPFALALMISPLGCLIRPFALLAAPFLIGRMAPKTERVEAAVLEIARIRQLVRHRVTIGIVGSPSTGKDAGIKALFGIDTGNVSPIAGSTREVSIQQVPGATALFLVNTPGMGDVVERVTEEARQILDHIDVYLYVVNAEGGVQAREKADYDRCRSSGKPVLALVNKVDVLRPRDVDRFLEDTRKKLDAPPEHFTPVAFDPLPELAPGPLHLEAVHAWLRDRLAELGKDPQELPPLPTRPPPADG